RKGSWTGSAAGTRRCSGSAAATSASWPAAAPRKRPGPTSSAGWRRARSEVESAFGVRRGSPLWFSFQNQIQSGDARRTPKSKESSTMSRTVEITELALRDGHQSLLATRMALEDMAPACTDIDQAGYWSVECWGGATYDSCIRFLNEDPWERLRAFRKLLPNSRLQMLLRAQNLLGYRHYEDTVVDRFVDKSAENGMDVFRVFDALHDIRNLRRALQAV